MTEMTKPDLRLTAAEPARIQDLGPQREPHRLALLSLQRKESRLRKRVRRLGYVVRKSRHSISLRNFGDYMLLDAEKNLVVTGSCFDARLDDLENFLAG